MKAAPSVPVIRSSRIVGLPSVLETIFTRIDVLHWQSMGLASGEGPHVSIEGVYQDHEVFVQVLAYAPEYEEPETGLDTT